VGRLNCLRSWKRVSLLVPMNDLDLKSMFLIKHWLIFTLCFSLIVHAEEYKSKEDGFRVEFPSETKVLKLDKYSWVYTSTEITDELFIMHQVAIMLERPGGPLSFKSNAEYQTFLKTFIQGLMQSTYSNTQLVHSKYFLWEGHYPAMKYSFSGVMMDYDIPVMNEGIIVIHNKKIKKVSAIYPLGYKDIERVQNSLEKLFTSFHIF